MNTTPFEELIDALANDLSMQIGWDVDYIKVIIKKHFSFSNKLEDNFVADLLAQNN